MSETVLEESMRWSDRGGLDLRETSEYCDRPIGSGIKLSVTSERGKGVKKAKKKHKRHTKMGCLDLVATQADDHLMKGMLEHWKNSTVRADGVRLRCVNF